MVTVGKVATVAVGMMLTVGLLYSQSRGQPSKLECVTPEERIIIRARLLEAIEDGLKDHMKTLFIGWIKDPTHQPQRASAGIQAAVVAYQRARSDALKWNPTIC